ncbi:hypothetical protein [Lentilactobacillus sp. Marseille-Q4993]|uniref:hypothetical protein n=1 Tax=Lentilactobacillus sp. Marseille-Q4993 TaxID=3039492 RepID=UPI0024BD23E7|nr:hypothetical protein [Lentilactobacillus sp. Marseille-Q4993]
MTQQLGEKDLGTYEYVSKVYNDNMRIPAYKLPKEIGEGEQTIFDSDLITMIMEIKNQRVLKVTIITDSPRSTEYMQVFEGFEFGLEALGTWINTYHRSTTNHGPAEDVVNGILASYNTTDDDVLTVSLTRAQ